MWLANRQMGSVSRSVGVFHLILAVGCTLVWAVGQNGAADGRLS